MKNFIVVIFLVFFPTLVYGHPTCTTTIPCRTESITQTNQSIDDINNHVDDEFEAHRVWTISILWEDNILPAMMLMSEQLTAVAMKQVEIIGSFMDAKHQMETQQLFSELRSKAHKDYSPSVGMCEFGSSIKSLAASERIGEINAVVLSQRSQDRMLGNANTSAAGGSEVDMQSRLKQFREVYCNPADNNNGLDFMCEHDQDQNPSNGPVGAGDQLRMNKDIDFARTLDMPWTLNMDFTDGATTPSTDEEDVLALSANLYGSEVLYRPGSGTLESSSELETTAMQRAYLDARAVLAKRSVAENSFNAVAGMKSAGTAGSRDFLEALLSELGVDDATTNVKTSAGDVTQLDAMLGENPSYYAQMEVLTKKIYQNPDFFTNLYDKPANVERKGVALQAIGLMQKFDLFKSYLRNEATMSVLLELAVIDLQRDVENKIRETAAQLEGAKQ